MKVLILMPILLITFACKPSQTPSHVSAWEKKIWQKQVVKSKAKLWREDHGGRSWMKQDEIAYDKWISKTSPSILEEWDIPFDCADSVMALRFIFALKHGLAIRFGRFNSIDYWDKPMLLLKNATNSYGTQEIGNFSYAINMWDLANYKGGNFVLTSNHSFTLKGIDENHVFTILSGFPPISVKSLRESKMFSQDGTGQVFRRFYAYTRQGRKISANKDLSFEVHPPRSVNPKDWYACLEGDEVHDIKETKASDNKPLWQNIYNYVASLKHKVEYNEALIKQDGINCPHNVHWLPKYVKEGSAVPPAPDFEKILSSMFDDLCSYIQERAVVVNEGYAKCFAQKSDECSKDQHGDYSTPTRDNKIFARVMSWFELSSSLKKTLYFYNQKCSIDFNKGRLGTNPFIKEVKFLGNYSTYILPSVWMGIAFSDTSMVTAKKPAYDPTLSIPERWGCDSNDHNLSCVELSGMDDFARSVIKKSKLEKQEIEIHNLTTFRLDDFFIWDNENNRDAILLDSFAPPNPTQDLFVQPKGCNMYKGDAIKIVGLDKKMEMIVIEVVKIAELIEESETTQQTYKNRCQLGLTSMLPADWLTVNLGNKNLSKIE